MTRIGLITKVRLETGRGASTIWIQSDREYQYDIWQYAEVKKFVLGCTVLLEIDGDKVVCATLVSLRELEQLQHLREMYAAVRKLAPAPSLGERKDQS